MTVLGERYELGVLLGRGGMAEVYRARDTVLGRDVAVKVFRHVDEVSADERTAGEVQLLAGLSHPGLVTVFDAGRDADAFNYLVMEYVPGTTLRHRLDLGPVPPEETARLGAELAEALAYVHARGIVHRDIKPANILLTPDGTAKLTDFGVAKLLDGTRLTVTGTTLGTPNYLSPEQATGAVVTGASDVYSLGLVLLECLTGAVAYPGHGVEAAVVRLHRPPAIPADLGAGWVALLTGMTEADPARRPDAGTVATALRALGSDAAPTVALLAPTAGTRTLPVPTRTRRPLWLAGGVLAAAAAAAVVATTLDGGSPAAPAPTSSVVSPSTTAPTTPRTSSSSATSPTVVRRSTTSSHPAPNPPPPHGKPKKKHEHGKKPKPEK